VKHISVSHDGQVMTCTSGLTNDLVVFDCSTLRPVGSYRFHVNIVSAALSRDGHYVLGHLLQCGLVVWDFNNGKKLREIPTNGGNVSAISDHGDVVAASTMNDFISVWDLRRGGDLIYTFEQHCSEVTAVCFSRQRELLASGGANGEVFVWRTSGMVLMKTMVNGTPTGVAFSCDGDRLLVTTEYFLSMYDVVTGANTAIISSEGVRASGFGLPLEPPLVRACDVPSTPKWTWATFGPGNTVVGTTSHRQLLLCEPNEFDDILSLTTSLVIVAGSCCENGAVLADTQGNMYRLTLIVPQREESSFARLCVKPPEKAKVD